MNERVSDVLKHPLTVPVAIGVSFVGGLGLGYILGKRNRDVLIAKEYEQMTLDQELEVNNTYDPLVVVKDEVIVEPRVFGFEEEEEEETPEDEVVVEETEAEKIREAMERPKVMAPPINVPEVHKEFSANDDDWDYEKELEARTNDKPHVIHKDEFWAEELGYTQTTLTYYSGDDIMADEDDTPVYDYKRVVGPLLFGHGSAGDPNVFYVRNDARRAEYEILFDEGLYSQEVLGLEIENNERVKDLKHSRNQKFRTD